MAMFPGLVSVPERRAGLADDFHPPAFDAALTALPLGRLIASFGRLAAWFGALVLAAVGMLVAVRRLAGAFVVSLGGWEFGGLVAAGAVLLVAVEQASRGRAARAAALLARCGFVVAVLAVGLPQDRGSWNTSATPFMAVAAAAAALLTPLLMPVAVGRGVAASLRNRRPSARPPHAARPDRPRRRRSRSRPGPLPGRLSQRQARYRLETGAECIRGRIHLEIPAGARAAHGHLGFCPAFAQLPDVHVDTAYDGVEATVAAAEVVPWGVRIECRLAEPAEEPIEIPVDVTARTRT